MVMNTGFAIIVFQTIRQMSSVLTNYSQEKGELDSTWKVHGKAE